MGVRETSGKRAFSLAGSGTGAQRNDAGRRAGDAGEWARFEANQASSVVSQERLKMFWNIFESSRNMGHLPYGGFRSPVAHHDAGTRVAMGTPEDSSARRAPAATAHSVPRAAQRNIERSSAGTAGGGRTQRDGRRSGSRSEPPSISSRADTRAQTASGQAALAGESAASGTTDCVRRCELQELRGGNDRHRLRRKRTVGSRTGTLVRARGAT